MRGDELNALAARIESKESNGALLGSVVSAIKAAFPQPAQLLGPDPALLQSTEAALHVINCIVPVWEISARGVALEPDGHWTCTIRESNSPDDVEVVGVGQGPCLPRALIAALLRVGAQRVRG